MSLLRGLVFWLAVACASAAGAQGASAPAELYQAKAIVTGTGEENRQIGFALALEDVLVKVSGDPRLIGDPRVAKLAEDAGALVVEFRYRDRLEGIPVHDEQGTHDRPHDLTVLFAPEKINAALHSLGSRPWPDARPTLTLLLNVEHGAQRFVLSRDNAAGIDMRDSLASASAKMGIPVTLPSDSVIAKIEATQDWMTRVDPTLFAYLIMQTDGSVPLVGSLVWSDEDLGWIADWTVGWNGKAHHWQVRGVSFDDAFRNAIRGAARVLSGNGNP